MNRNEKLAIASFIGLILVLGTVAGFLSTQKSKVNKEEPLTTHLFDLNMTINDEILYVNGILDDVPMHCYNIGIYNGLKNGTVVIYNDMLEKIINGTMGKNPARFIDNTIVREYFAKNCLHLDSMSQVPKNFTSNVGINQTMMMEKWHVTKDDLPFYGR